MRVSEHIQQTIHDYANHHDVDPDLVEITRVYDEDGNITAIWLSLDIYGVSRGYDEKITITERTP